MSSLTPEQKFEAFSDSSVILILQFSLQLTDKVLFYRHSACYLSFLDKGYYMLPFFSQSPINFLISAVKLGQTDSAEESSVMIPS